MSTDTNCLPCPAPEIWAGIECTINRINDTWRDQLAYSGHYKREDDIDKFASLGIRSLRYPVLWELHEPFKKYPIDWYWIDKQLSKIRSYHINPIIGLLHHGSGPAFTSLDKEDFPAALANYAKQVAEKFPWVEHYTPVNEPLTTARFSGLYGAWYPHQKNERSFIMMLLHQLKATVLGMLQIRSVNSSAKLIQTEDLAKIHSTGKLKYQADFENERRWLTYDILCGRFDKHHSLWNYFIDLKINERLLNFFIENPCPPDIIGANYYITSERFLDDDLSLYPPELHGGNKKDSYADIAAVHKQKQTGLKNLLIELWDRYHIPVAVTESHINCTREEQMRWLKEAWDTCYFLCKENIPVKALTAWSLLGAYDWDSLLTKSEGHYESGIFAVNNDEARITATGKLIRSLASGNNYDHPLLYQYGWWNKNRSQQQLQCTKNNKSILIIGSSGTLGSAFKTICNNRSIPFAALSRKDIDITAIESIRNAIDLYKPWAIINASGYVRVDDAEENAEECFMINTIAPALIAKCCREAGIKFMTFSSDLVFDGEKSAPYFEADHVRPLNIYGESKARGERLVTEENADALIIRTSAFFGPWDSSNFAWDVLNSLKNHKTFSAINNIFISPTYVPDLVNASLDLFIDEEKNIWHLSNDGSLSWFDFACEIADHAGYKKDGLHSCLSDAMQLKAKRPLYSVLQSKKGIKLPSLSHALGRFFKERAV